ncbi:hypothetical protein [Mycobacterium sp. MUNTM1]
MRLARRHPEVCADVVTAVGGNVAVGIRISQAKVSDNDHRWAGGQDDAAVIFTALADTGIDYIHLHLLRADGHHFTSAHLSDFAQIQVVDEVRFGVG